MSPFKERSLAVYASIPGLAAARVDVYLFLRLLLLHARPPSLCCSAIVSNPINCCHTAQASRDDKACRKGEKGWVLNLVESVMKLQSFPFSGSGKCQVDQKPWSKARATCDVSAIIYTVKRSALPEFNYMGV